MKRTDFIPALCLAAVIVLGTGLLTIAILCDKVDFKYCSDSGNGIYYTVTGTDTTYYNTNWQRGVFSGKWVAHK